VASLAARVLRPQDALWVRSQDGLGAGLGRVAGHEFLSGAANSPFGRRLSEAAGMFYISNC
jgi:hypothetical protein